MMTLITGFTCPPSIYFKFITKCDSFFYYEVRWPVITKCDSFFIKKCDKCYYKVRQILQSVTISLQSATGITKCDSTHHDKSKNSVKEKFHNYCFCFLCHVHVQFGLLCLSLHGQSKDETDFNSPRATTNKDIFLSFSMG